MTIVTKAVFIKVSSYN